MKLENKILIGTNNSSKFKQFKAAFFKFAPEIEVMMPSDLGIMEDVEEDGEDLLTNAKKKAKFYGEKSGLICLSDDTGLFVDALNGEPGLHSKRWHAGTETDRNHKLIERMKGIEDRKAHYTGVLATYGSKTKEEWSFEGRVEGEIMEEFRGTNGHGYDSIFKTARFGKHYSELTLEEEAQISHRYNGVKNFLEYLKK